MLTAWQITVLVLVAVLGHVMALFWYLAVANKWKIAEHLIYNLPIPPEQIRREWHNSIHTPLHAAFLAVFLELGFFQAFDWLSFLYSAILATVWAEIWHYASHRAFHLRSLHWIHVEHHRSHINSWLTALSFSFTEKFVFDLGLLCPLAIVDRFIGLNFYGVAGWYIGYLIINSYSHANFEFKSARYNHWLGKVLATTTYHSLHHARYTGNYGLGTRFLDKLFGTEWADYDQIFQRISRDRKPLTNLREKVAPPVTSA